MKCKITWCRCVNLCLFTPKVTYISYLIYTSPLAHWYVINSFINMTLKSWYKFRKLCSAWNFAIFFFFLMLLFWPLAKSNKIFNRPQISWFPPIRLQTMIFFPVWKPELRIEWHSGYLYYILIQSHSFPSTCLISFLSTHSNAVLNQCGFVEVSLFWDIVYIKFIHCMYNLWFHKFRVVSTSP